MILKLKLNEKNNFYNRKKLTLEQMESTMGRITFCQSVVVMDGAFMAYGWAETAYSLTPIGAVTGAALGLTVVTGPIGGALLVAADIGCL